MLTFILIGGLVWLMLALLFMVALVLAARRKVPSVVPTEAAEEMIPQGVSFSATESELEPAGQPLLPFEEQPAAT